MGFLKFQLDLSLFNLFKGNLKGLQKVDRLKDVDAELEVDGPIELFDFPFKYSFHVLLVVLFLQVIVVVAHVDLVADW